MSDDGVYVACGPFRFLAQTQTQKGFDVGAATGGTIDEGDEKIFGAILRVLPRVLQAAPGIAQAFAGARR